MLTTRHPRACAAVRGGGLAFALTLTGCTADTGAKATATPTEAPAVTVTPAPATTPADPQAAEKAAALKVFASMWAERAKVYAKADLKGTSLEKFATAGALGKIRFDLARMREAGTVVRSAPRQTAATVTSLDLAVEIPTAMLTSCVDMTTCEAYSTMRKEVIPLPIEQPMRYAAATVLEKWPTGWIVTIYTPTGSRRAEAGSRRGRAPGRSPRPGRARGRSRWRVLRGCRHVRRGVRRGRLAKWEKNDLGSFLSY
ncbi:hypothetical protein ACFFSH_39205 [Streptomyces filamentosus]|uniref:Lipoprotein n=1 Tax=Streptomyces filamentosus TaxID=67294 RepID=A0A919BWB8_STRFL|nr:hypothetical protein [Streptomyces filamentosus]GHG23701.1 hypothetical protein GCM10017667_68930 [Streptomyces filamentosus]